MFKKIFKAVFVLVLGGLVISTTQGQAAPKIGELAPKFERPDQTGKKHSLDSFKGKWVVLEWYNEGCPYVKKHYGSKNMQGLQEKYTAKGVVWLTVATSAEGKQGYVAPDKAAAHMKDAGMKSTALLLDSDGTMGKAYDAKTTPHMYIVNPQGQLVYAGAIDDNDSSNPEKIKTSKNYISMALDEAMSGKPITMASTKPYGCGVKYK